MGPVKNLLNGKAEIIILALVFCAHSNQAKSNVTGWVDLSDIPSGPSQYHGAVAVGEVIYLLGGVGSVGEILRDLRAFNTTSNTWSIKKPCPIAMHRPNVGTVNGKIYVLGALLPTYRPTGKCWVYDPAVDLWEELAGMGGDQARGAAAVGVNGQQIIIAGGFQGFQATGLTSIYNTAAATWTHGLALMKHPRDHALGVVLGKDLYVIGGRNGTLETASKLIEVYIQGNDTWSSGGKILLSRAGLGGDVVGTNVVLMGGESAFLREVKAEIEIVGSIEVCSGKSLKCEESGAMVTPRHGMSVVNVENSLYISGGAEEPLFGALAMHQSYVPA